MIKIKQEQAVLVAGCIMCTVLSILFHMLHVANRQFVIIEILWYMLFSAVLFVGIAGLQGSKELKIIVLFAVVLRIALVLLTEYGQGGAADFLAVLGDQDKFLQIADSYYGGDFSQYATDYPYIILLIYQVCGKSTIMVRIINVLFWFLGIILLNAVGKDLCGKRAEYFIAFYSILPFHVLLTTEIMRESIMSFFLMSSLYYLWKWMKRGRNIFLAASTVLCCMAILLHNGNIALLGTIFLTYIFWEPHKRRWEIITWKAVFLVLAIILALPLYDLIAVKLFPGKLPITLSFESMTTYTYKEGRADYVAGDMIATNLIQFIFYTMYRSLYFWISPTPRFWNSPLDIIGFVMDSVPWILFLVFYGRNLMRKKITPESFVGVFIFLTYTFIYAWGTRNGGTAMRHRDTLLGILLMARMMGVRREHQWKNGK